MTSFHTYQTGLKVVVDDQVEIYHPPSSHPISIEQVYQQLVKYLTTAKAIEFLDTSKRRIEREKKLSRVGERLINAIPWMRKEVGNII